MRLTGKIMGEIYTSDELETRAKCEVDICKKFTEAKGWNIAPSRLKGLLTEVHTVKGKQDTLEQVIKGKQNA